MEYFNYNGKNYKESEGVLLANSRGLRYGDGLFETLKAIQGTPEFLDEHLARLWKGLQVLQFTIPKHFSPDLLEAEIASLLKKNGHRNMARIRLTLFRGEGGLYDAINHAPNYLVQSWALPGNTGSWNSNGIVAGIYPAIKKSCDILSNLKHNNFLPYSMAALYAKEQKWNDAILLNEHGRLCDSTIANIFIIRDGIIYTPALQEGCIAGIMRKNLITRMTSAGMEVIEAPVSVKDLLDAEEVFFTNSIYNMRWVQSINDKKYTHAATLEIYNNLFSTNP